MEAVKVTWIDSCASNLDWILKDNIDKWENIAPMTIYTYGVIVTSDDNYIVVAQNYGMEPEQCCSLMSIPRGCIIEMKTLENIDKN